MAAMTRQAALKRWKALETERSSWDATNQAVAGLFAPYVGRYDRNPNEGYRRDQKVLDSTTMQVVRDMAAGMSAGLSSKSMPWFAFTLEDRELAANHSVKLWLDTVTDLIRAIFAKSNIYDGLNYSYVHQGVVGTYCSMIVPDFENVLWEYPFVAGEYCIACDDKDRPATVARKFKRTVENIVQSFGTSKCSSTVRRLYDQGKYEHHVDVLHIVEPRRDRNPGSPLAKDKAWSSCYYEYNGDGEQPLRESGFDDFPGVCPRWEREPGDAYGRSPAWMALGDAAELQDTRKSRNEAIALQSRPPVIVPPGLSEVHELLVPGGVIPGNAATDKVVSAYQVPLRVDHTQLAIDDLRNLIRDALFVDVFTPLMMMQRKNMTATEVAQIQSEALLMAGPVLDRQERENLRKRVDLAFIYVLKADLLPPIPEELQGQELKIEFVSMLSQALKARRAAGNERLLTTVGVLAQTQPGVLDNVDYDYAVNALSDDYGADPRILIAGEKVSLVREQRAQQQMQQQAMEQQAIQAKTMKDLAGADMSGNNALTEAAQ